MKGYSLLEKFIDKYSKYSLVLLDYYIWLILLSSKNPLILLIKCKKSIAILQIFLKIIGAPSCISNSSLNLVVEFVCLVFKMRHAGGTNLSYDLREYTHFN